MNKILTTLLMALIAVMPMAARDRVSRNVNDLPATAQATLNKYFAKSNVNHIKIDSKTFGGKEYDVILDDGTEIEFDSKGNMKDIDAGTRGIPSAMILKPIRDYIKANFKGQKIVSMEVKSNKYEIELSNGVDLEFDRNGNFRKVDY